MKKFLRKLEEKIAKTPNKLIVGIAKVTLVLIIILIIALFIILQSLR